MRARKFLFKSLHPSWAIVALAMGVIAGTVLGLVFRINFFGSGWFLVFALILLGFAIIKPKALFITLALIAGLVLAFFRVASELKAEQQATQPAQSETTFVLVARDWFADRVRSTIPEKESSLGLSYLLGLKTNLDKSLDENLRLVGLTHIVVASGAHLAILVEVAKKLFGKISRFAGLVFSIIFIVLFMVMVGWTPSIMRAGIMSILTLITWYVGRRISPLRMITLVAALTLVISPSFIINLGWLLSFASFGGIMLLGPALTKFFYGKKKPGFIASTILTTLAATIMTLPLTLYFFGQISLISVIANLLILPTLPYAMGLVFFAGALGGLPLVSTIISFFATKILDYHIAVVEFFGSLTQFLIKIEKGNALVFLIYAAILLPPLILLARRLCNNRLRYRL